MQISTVHTSDGDRKSICSYSLHKRAPGIQSSWIFFGKQYSATHNICSQTQVDMCCRLWNLFKAAGIPAGVALQL